jgi:hypothetical protein
MASKIKVMPQKEEMLEKEGPETQSDRPLLDLSAAAVKELIRNAKKRGYVTHDQIDALLSSEEVKSELSKYHFDEWRQVRMSRGYIHSSFKSSDTSPNVFKIVASPKFPMFGSPLRFKASAPALAGSRDIDSARRIAAVSLDISCAWPGATPSSVLTNGRAT